MRGGLEQAVRVGATVVLSLALHWGAVAALPDAWQYRPPSVPDAVEISLDTGVNAEEPIVEAEEAPSPPPSAPKPPPATAAAARPSPKGPETAKEVASAGPTEPDAEPDEPLDFGDLLLASAGDGPGIQSGTATAGDTPTGRRAGSPTGSNSAAPSGDGPPTEALGSLSRRPEPPDISRLLENNFPGKARSQGREGKAVIKLKIDASGQATVVKTLSDSDPDLGFATACSKTLNGTRWSPPIGRKGSPVATYVEYSCNFRIRY